MAIRQETCLKKKKMESAAASLLNTCKLCCFETVLPMQEVFTLRTSWLNSKMNASRRNRKVQWYCKIVSCRDIFLKSLLHSEVFTAYYSFLTQNMSLILDYLQTKTTNVCHPYDARLFHIHDTVICLTVIYLRKVCTETIYFKKHFLMLYIFLFSGISLVV